MTRLPLPARVLIAALITVAAVLILLLPLAGCGGGGGSANGTRLKLTVHWPSRSRDVQPPGGANSVVVHVEDAREDGADLHWIIPRPIGNAEQTSDYQSSETVRVGAFSATIEFRENADDTGNVLGIASLIVTIDAAGGGIPTITSQGSVDHITVSEGQDVLVGEKRLLGASAFNPQNQIVALAPDALTWNVTSGSDKVRFVTEGGSPTQKAEGLAAGSATVEAVAAGKTSAAVTLQVAEGGVVGTAGGTATTADGKAKVVFPAGALQAETRVVIAPEGNPPPDERLLSGTAYRFKPEGATFQQPATLTLKYNPASLPLGVPESALGICKVVNNVWTHVPGSVVNAANDTVSAPVSSFSVYGILQLGGATTSGPVAYVVDEPQAGRPEQFTNLQPAVDYVCTQIKPGEVARVILDTNRDVPISTLRMECKVRFERAQGRTGRITTSAGSIIESDQDIAFSNTTIGGSAVVFNVGGRLDLLNNKLPEATTINFGATRSARSRAASAVGGLIDKNDLGNGKLTMNGGVTEEVVIRENVLSDIEATMKLEAAAKWRASKQLFNKATGQFDVAGNGPEVALENSTGAELTVGMDGVGTGTMKCSASTFTKATINSSVKQNTVTDTGCTYSGQLDVKLFEKAGIVPKLTYDGTSPSIGGDLKLVSAGENGTLDFTLHKATVSGAFDAELAGKVALLKLDQDTVVNGIANVRMKGDNFKLDSSQTTWKAGAQLTQDGAPLVEVGLRSANSTFEGPLRAQLNEGVAATVEITDAGFVKGAQAVLGFVTGRSRKAGKPATSRGRAPGEVVFRNCTFDGGAQTAIRVDGATTSDVSSVLVENCPKIEGAVLGIVIAEVDAPVTVRNCILTKGGIGLDGDIEGEGRTGSINKPYTVGPTVTVQAPLGPGLTAEDLQNVTVTGSTINGSLSVSKARMTAQNNTINGPVSVNSGRLVLQNNTLNTPQPIVVNQGPSTGPGVLIATGNTIGGAVAIGSNGYAALAGNTWADISGVLDGNGSGGLLNDPVGGGLRPESVNSKVDFNGNGCADYPNVPDKDPETGACFNGAGVPVPPDPG